VDDGRGFSRETAVEQAEGWGLRGIRERAALLGGRCVIRSAPGFGVQIRVCVPLNLEGKQDGQNQIAAGG
jgi:signal transduction histidine kinase